jgi:hypothetical protein
LDGITRGELVKVGVEIPSTKLTYIITYIAMLENCPFVDDLPIENGSFP